MWYRASFSFQAKGWDWQLRNGHQGDWTITINFGPPAGCSTFLAFPFASFAFSPFAPLASFALAAFKIRILSIASIAGVTALPFGPFGPFGFARNIWGGCCCLRFIVSRSFDVFNFRTLRTPQFSWLRYSQGPHEPFVPSPPPIAAFATHLYWVPCPKLCLCLSCPVCHSDSSVACRRSQPQFSMSSALTRPTAFKTCGWIR